MGLLYTITAAKMGNGSPDNYGNVPWWIDVTDGEQAYEALLMRKPDSPTPQGQVFGRIETKTSQAGNEYLRFYTEQNPNGGGPAQAPQQQGGGQQRPQQRSGGDGSPPDDPKQKRIEAQSARRDAVAMVVATRGTEAKVEHVELLTELFVRMIDKLATVAAPTPSAPPAPAGGSPGTAPQAPANMGGGPAVDFASQDIRLALAACGQDNANPEQTYHSLDQQTKSQVDLIYANLVKKGESGPDDWKTPDEMIPFD
jgi:hypothetical protein